MVSLGTGTQQIICILIAYHPSFMVHWWVLVHSARIGEHTSQVKPERIPVVQTFYFYHTS